MKRPTLHERITIKGYLIPRGVPPKELIAGNAKTLIHYWHACMGTPISYAFTQPKRFFTTDRKGQQNES